MLLSPSASPLLYAGSLLQISLIQVSAGAVLDVL
jgi:hypothetical protein